MVAEMASRDFEDYTLRGRSVPRRLVQISGEQRELLDDDTSWAESLSAGQHAMVNVPSEVIDTIKDFYARKSAKSMEQSLPASWPPTLAAAGSSPQRSPRKTPERRHSNMSSPAEGSGAGQAVEQEAAARSQDDERSDAGTEISWSQTPTRTQRQANRVLAVSRRVGSSPASGKAHSSPPPRRKLDVSFMNDIGSSSAGDDDGLEMEPPGALSQQTAPVNRAARPAVPIQPVPTPPSEQLPVIPSTYGDSGDPTKQPAPKRRRLMTPIAFNTTSQLSRPSAVPNVSSRLELEPGAFIQGSSATTGTTGSMPVLPTKNAPEQVVDASMDKSSPASVAGQDNSSSAGPGNKNSQPRRPAPQTQESENHSSLREARHSSPSAPPPAQPSARREEVLASKAPTASEELVRGAKRPSSHLAPYEVFNNEYPDYKESLNMFVRACLTVVHFQRARALPQFLYDDFVRVFSNDYCSYIQAHFEDEVPLTAIQWYNVNVVEPKYNKGVITRDNLDDILEIYELEAQRVFAGSVKESAASPSDHAKVSEAISSPVRQLAQEPTHSLDRREPTPRRETPMEITPAGSPELHLGSPEISTEAEEDPPREGQRREGSTIRNSDTPRGRMELETRSPEKQNQDEEHTSPEGSGQDLNSQAQGIIRPSQEREEAGAVSARTTTTTTTTTTTKPKPKQAKIQSVASEHGDAASTSDAPRAASRASHGSKELRRTSVSSSVVGKQSTSSAVRSTSRKHSKETPKARSKHLREYIRRRALERRSSGYIASSAMTEEKAVKGDEGK